MFAKMKRALFKSAVVGEFHKRYGLNLRALGDQIGPGTLDDLLNLQYIEAQGNVALATTYVSEVLRDSFHIDVEDIVRRARLGIL